MALVFTQPDRPTGRGLRATPSAVKRFALDHSLPLLQPAGWRDGQALEALRAARVEALVVAAYGRILPAAALVAPVLGAINIHASLLPRWRGAAPIQRALLAGDRETGITIMQMDEGLDTGAILAQQTIAIAEDEDAGSLHDRLAELGARMIGPALSDLAAGRARSRPQPSEGVTYAAKVDKAETRLDWSRSARELERATRAFRPAPGCSTRLAGANMKVWQAGVHAGAGAPGTVLAADARAIVVACGEDAMAITELQREGGKRLTADEFLRGHPLSPGDRFE